MKNCLDCSLCKISRTKGIIWCAQDMWESNNGEERRIKLDHREIRFEGIKPRKIFNYANQCILYDAFAH